MVQVVAVSCHRAEFYTGARDLNLCLCAYVLNQQLSPQDLILGEGKKVETQLTFEYLSYKALRLHKD